MNLRRIGLISALLLAVPAGAQVTRGTPASVNSYGGGRGFRGGVPASVTSISPALPMSPCGGAPGMLIPSALGCGNPVLSPSVNFQQGRPGFDGQFPSRGNRRGRRGGAVPVAVPYGYPYGVYSTYDPQLMQPEQPPIQINIQIEDRRDREDLGLDDGLYVRGNDYDSEDRRSYDAPRRRPRAPEPEPVRDPEPQREIIPTVLIYRNGSQREVRNYAIVGKTLYDFASMASQRIQLADLDLPATAKANEDRGVDFAVPRGIEIR